MTRLLAIFMLCGTALGADITFAWDPNPTNQMVRLYLLYQSSNVLGPYVPVGQTAGTNITLTNLVPQQAFWCLRASNAWGLSEPSSNVFMPPQASPVKTLSVRRSDGMLGRTVVVPPTPK